MGLKTFPGGIHPHDYKEYSKEKKIEKMPLPKKVHIHLIQHIGAPSKPIVKVGEQVLVGQKIAEAASFVSVHQHASISGKVTKIAPFAYPMGTNSMAIEITSDGEDKWIELIDDENYLKHTYAYMDKDGNVEISYGAVTMGEFEPEVRSY
jgi:electron transport complex protein RnfC